jgi:hypothetical protein
VKAKVVPGVLAFLALLPLSALSAPSPLEKRDAIQIDELVRGAAANHQARRVLQNDYTYVAHCVWSRFGSGTKRPKPSSADFEIMFLEGEPYMRQIRYNNQPISPEQEKRQMAVMDAFAKARREAKKKPGRPSSFYTALELPIAQLPEAFNLHMKGKQRLDGREVYVIEALPKDAIPKDGLPKDGQGPAGDEQEHARHFKMKLWIDPGEAQIVKLEAVVVRDIVMTDIPTITGPFVNETPLVSESQQVRFLDKPGGIIRVEWTKLDDGAWLPKHFYSKMQERIWLDLPNSDSSSLWRKERDWTYSNYKKFRVKATIVP